MSVGDHIYIQLFGQQGLNLRMNEVAPIKALGFTSVLTFLSIIFTGFDGRWNNQHEILYKMFVSFVQSQSQQGQNMQQQEQNRKRQQQGMGLGLGLGLGLDLGMNMGR